MIYNQETPKYDQQPKCDLDFIVTLEHPKNIIHYPRSLVSCGRFILQKILVTRQIFNECIPEITYSYSIHSISLPQLK